MIDSLLNLNDLESLNRALRLCRFLPPVDHSTLLLSLLRLPLYFKRHRTPAYLSHIISSELVLKKRVLLQTIHSSKKRHLSIRILQSELQFPFGNKPALGILVAFNVLNQREVLEETQMREAINQVIPEVQFIQDSFLYFRENQEPVHVAYLEIEPTFIVKQSLEVELKKHIKELVSKTFTRRNEEEVFKNIQVLRDQLQSPHDLPQAIIQFEEQKDPYLIFTVILVRIQKDQEPTVRDLIKKSGSSAVFIPDRIAKVGENKEATVFRLQFYKSNFLRKDGSVNLYQGRKEAITVLEQSLGPIRDYNGGSMDLQSTVLKEFIELVPETEDSFLLENFFYSITPLEMQSVLSAKVLYEWFSLFSQLFPIEINPKSPFHFLSATTQGFWMMAIKLEDLSFKKELRSIVKKGIFAEFNQNGEQYLGCLCRQPANFEKRIGKELERWNQRETNRHLRLILQDVEFNLDPRIAKEDQSHLVGKMLFEGLTRIDRYGKPSLALAESYEVSADFKRYVFHLKPTKWSNGNVVTAFDFEYSWKKALCGSDLPTPFLYPLLLLKNGRRAKQIPDREIGVTALNERTLLIELETATPHFLEVAAHWSYSLINRSIDIKHPGWANSEGAFYVCNGPFRLIQREPIAILEKNPYYWDAPAVKLKQISIFKRRKGESIGKMLSQGTIDIAGRPLCAFPTDIFEEDIKTIETISQPLQGILSLCFNTAKAPFNHPKMRQAFALAIDPSLFAKNGPHEFGKLPLSLLPDLLSFYQTPLLPAYNPQQAKALFLEAMHESPTPFRSLTLSFCNSMNRDRLFLALKKQFESIFPLQIQLQPSEWSAHFQNLLDGSFHMGIIELQALWSDPLHFLEFFEQKENPLNISNWESPYFQFLLQKGRSAATIADRNGFLKEAELFLTEELPAIPLYQLQGNYLKRKNLSSVSASEFFSIDFKWALKKNLSFSLKEN